MLNIGMSLAGFGISHRALTVAWQREIERIASIIPAETFSLSTPTNISAMNFNGSHTVMTAGVPPAITGQLTVETWVRMNAIAADTSYRLVEKPHTSHVDPYYIYGLQMHYNGFPRFDLTTSNTLTTLVSAAPVTACVADRWYHVAGTYDGAMMKLYRDGILIASGAKTGPISTSVNPFYFGGHGNVTSEKHNGQLDEIRLWSYARSQTEISGAMMQTLTGATGLVGCWSMNEGTGLTTVNTTNLTSGAQLTDGVSFYNQSLPYGSILDWLNRVTGAAGTVDYQSIKIATDLTTGIYGSTYSGKIKYFLPMIGTNLSGALTPLINTFAVGNPINTNFTNSDFTLTGGLKGNGSSKGLTLNITPGQLGSGNNGGLGYIENDIDFGGNGVEPIGRYSNGGQRYVVDLRSNTAGFQWGDPTAGTNPYQAAAATNGHYYGQRSGTSSRELYKDRSLIAGVYNVTPSVTAMNDKPIQLMQNDSTYWKGRCAAAYLTDGTMTSGEISGFHSLLRDYLETPREVMRWQARVTEATGTYDATSTMIAANLLREINSRPYKNKIKYFLPILGTNINAARVPLIDAYNVGTATNVGFLSGDFTQTGGLQSDGVTLKYFDSKLNPSSLSSDNCGYGYVETNFNTDGYHVMGMSPNSAQIYNMNMKISEDRVFWGTSAGIPSSVTPGNGNWYFNRSSSTSHIMYKNGLQVHVNTSADTTTNFRTSPATTTT